MLRPPSSIFDPGPPFPGEPKPLRFQSQARGRTKILLAEQLVQDDHYASPHYNTSNMMTINC
jgi:hypothetical protein